MQEILTNRPQVILLGNGLIRSFGSDPSSWVELMEKLTVERYRNKISVSGLPNALQIILRTDGAVNGILKDNKAELMGEPVSPELAERIKSIYPMKPDHILTTNYSYEIEAAAIGRKSISENMISNMQKHTSEVDRCEGQYMIHTYIDAAGIPVWHIHGEARKIQSIVLGHYWYGTLLSKYLTIMDKRRSEYKDNDKDGVYKVKSWLDAVVMGDVYVLGFDFDVSEIDLWWLLNRKRHEFSERKGKLYFYSNDDSGNFNEKEELLKVCGAEVIHCNELPMPGTLSSNKYANYHDAALMDIENKIRVNRQ